MTTNVSDSSPHSQDEFARVFRGQSHNKRTPLPRNAARARLNGLILGPLCGFVYGIASQSINLVFMPEVPLAHHPFGFAGNTLAFALAGAVVGLVCSFPASAISGAALAGLAIILSLEVRAWLIQAVPLTFFIFSVFAPFALFAAGLTLLITIPFTLVMRWALDIQNEQRDRPLWSWVRMRGPLAVMFLVAGIGTLSLYPNEVRQAMNSTHLLIQEGLNTGNAEDLPRPLQDQNGVKNFRALTNLDYTIEQSTDDNLRHDIAVTAEFDSIIIIARFANGWSLACTFTGEGKIYRCKDYAPALAPRINDVRGMRVMDSQ